MIRLSHSWEGLFCWIGISWLVGPRSVPSNPSVSVLSINLNHSVDETMRTRIMNDRQVGRTLNRLAYEILERNRGASNLVVVGIETSGAVVASRLVDHLNQIEGGGITAHSLDVSGYRDDMPFDTSETGLPELGDRDVILVDDVLFTGRTARAAMDAVVRSGRPRSIQLLVLIDRGHREYPIQPDYVGRVMPTKHRERVEVDINHMVVEVVE